jgi:hypothetical protein
VKSLDTNQLFAIAKMLSLKCINDDYNNYDNIVIYHKERQDTINTSFLSCGGLHLKESSDFKYLMETCDGAIRIYNTKTQELLITILNFGGDNWIAFTPDNYFEGTEEAFSNLYFVDDGEIKDISAYYEQLYRPNLIERVLKGEEIEKSTLDMKNLKPQPKIEITNPSSGEIEFRGTAQVVDLSTDKKEFNLKYSITDQGGGIDEVRVFQNGKLVYSTDENTNEKNKTLKGSYKLNLIKGKNLINVTAFNNDRVEKRETVIIEYTGNIQEVANLYVLTIGLNQYQKSSYNLNYAQADADAFAEAIKKGSEGIFEKVEIINLRNDQATKVGIQQAIANIQAKAKQSDVFVFYYAGHGSMSVVEQGAKSSFYLIPYDVTNLYSDEILKNKAISSAQLQEFSKNIAHKSSSLYSMHAKAVAQ